MYVVIFVVSFLVYIYTLFPTIAPYRDAGEMAVVANTLSIAHPPGYPLYIILGNLFMRFVPFGNVAYKLNLFSAICSALSAVLLVRIITLLAKGISRFLFFPLFAIFAFSYIQWYLAIVSEMYTLSVLFVLVITFIAVSNFKNGTSLIAFLSGLGLGNRLDMLFALPGVFVYRYKDFIKPKALLTSVFLFVLGFSVYLFLPVRSAAKPLINWNKPDNIKALVSTISRRTHGGTLDLLSLAYEKGENFLDGLKFFVQSFIENFSIIGIAVLILGIVYLYKSSMRFLIFSVVGFLLSGPLFIYLANMPPNPHALAILEAHLILPMLFLMFIMSSGLIFMVRKWRYLFVLVIIFCLYPSVNNFRHLNKRGNFFAYDYFQNVMRSVGKNSIVVLKEDVQLFSMWYGKYVCGKRNDVVIIPQGLSGSLWYHELINKEAKDIYIERLDGEQSWTNLLTKNRRDVYITGDVDYRSIKDVREVPFGLATRLEVVPSSEVDVGLDIDDIYIYRGEYNYLGYKEFFTPDLIEEYMKSSLKIGNIYLVKGDYDRALSNFFRAAYMHPEYPTAYSTIGYIYYATNNFEKAEMYYEKANATSADMVRKAKLYKALPDVVESIKNDSANTLLNLGAVKEKLRKFDEALLAYDKALHYNPMFAQAHFNKAVIYWQLQRWKDVVNELEKTLRIDPNHRDAIFYLEMAKQRLR